MKKWTYNTAFLVLALLVISFYAWARSGGMWWLPFPLICRRIVTKQYDKLL